jgi:serine/threonine protein kinase
MMECPDLAGQVLDGKYDMTRELGRGGMGTVYLATHLGTERPVAIKVIAPQYMERAEFIERFRREARAAGRLRHPNVVNVTDFGFAETKSGRVAYLVMEYLDGCTLGEILDEEKNLPVGWTLDILEQVCSAVHEAHKQGIIHRDLKPDNIWLEPNQRGGYTVKVLDFGIAKLEEHSAGNGVDPRLHISGIPTYADSRSTTLGGSDGDTIADVTPHKTLLSEAGTMAKTAEGATVNLVPAASEVRTAIYDPQPDQDTIGTKVLAPEPGTPSADDSPVPKTQYDSKTSSELTRVGAVLGTPLYMSPEQCRGEHLDPRSDIYSLGVIAYQMLAGAPPFEGDFKDVMEAHKAVEPPKLRARKVRRKLKRTIHSALEKDPEKRPQTAEAFASQLRSRSEGIWGLLRRSMVIYSEHLGKFVSVSAFFSVPMIILTLIMLGLSFLRVSEIVSESASNVGLGAVGLALSFASAFCTNLIVGTIGWITIQYLSVPLRPVRVRPALKEARRKWKRIAGAAVLTAILPFGMAGIAGAVVFALIALATVPVTDSWAPVPIGAAAGFLLLACIGFFYSYVGWILVPPVVMLENVGVRAAMRRSRHLVKRSYATAMGAVLIMFLIPGAIAGSISFVVNITAKALDPKPAAESQQTAGEQPPAADEPAKRKDDWFNFSINSPGSSKVKVEDTDMRSRVRRTVLESLIQIFWLPGQIIVFSFSAIIVALLYLKTRLAGGESMNDLIERFDDDGRPKKKWQERVRKRLIQSGRISSNPSR